MPHGAQPLPLRGRGLTQHDPGRHALVRLEVQVGGEAMSCVHDDNCQAVQCCQVRNRCLASSMGGECSTLTLSKHEDDQAALSCSYEP
jgi:hypothetical protein